MLTLITGRGKSGKTSLLLKLVDQCPSKAMASRILLVPEQLSHQTERMLARQSGDSIGYVSEVLSFTRLYSRVCSVSGGGARPVLDQGGRLLSARLALDTVRPQLKVFARAAARAEFLSSMVSMIDELKAYEVTPRQLADIAEKTTGQFSDKLRELSLILSTYEAVTARGAADPRDKLTLLRKKLLSGEYASGRHFFVDNFSDFSGQELGVLEALLRTGESMTVTVPCGDPENPEPLFAPALETFSQLTALAKSLGQEVRVISADYRRPLPEALTYLENLFSYGGTPFGGNNDAVTVRSSDSVLEECRACGAVLKQHAMEGLRYRDMAIAASDETRYGPTLQSVFASMDIPLYRAEKRNVLSHPAVRFVLLALECALNGMEQEDVTAYFKTGFTGLSGPSIDLLENYAVTWAVRGGKWESEWTMHPEGYDGRFTEETAAQLSALNRDKQEALSPLFRLSRQLKVPGDVSGQLSAVYDFMQDTQLYDCLEQQVTLLTDSGRLEEAQETAQIWSILLELLHQIYSVLGRLSMTGEELLRVFQLALSQYQVGTIPAALDAVSFGGISAVRGQEPKILYVLGANEDLMPKASPGKSLLSEPERALLRDEYALQLAPDSEGNMQREMLTIYSAFTAPTKRLYVSYLTALGGEIQSPSFLVTRLNRLFPNCNGTSPGATALTVETAAEQYLSAKDPALQAMLSRVSQEIPALENAIQQGTNGACPRDTQVSPENAKALFGSPVPLTASRLDKLGSCPLDFFLYYGLKARPRKEASFDAAEFGTFVHFILEHTVPTLVSDRKELDLSGSTALVEGHLDAYRQQRLSAIPQTCRQSYLLSRNCSEAALLVQELSAELNRSDFIPCAYELAFGAKGALPALKVDGKLGQGAVSGFVDRVDLWNGPEGDFIRIVDYKTGTKKFDYTDLSAGVGMQMLLYLFALERSGIPGITASPAPAGVLYFPARRGFTSKDGPEDSEPTPQRRSGLVLGETEVLEAMEHGEDFWYLPVKRQRSGALGDFAVSREQLKLLGQFVEEKAAASTDQILGGDFAPKPYYRGISHDPCQWCDFIDVCGKDKQFRKTCYHENISAEQFWNSLKGGGDDGGNADDPAKSGR